ncbi:MAG: S8 family serine peptidase [Oscillospiraceae bacterium]|nr:S8 family serine peptidase [Oscillospiraceae bacterium]
MKIIKVLLAVLITAVLLVSCAGRFDSWHLNVMRADRLWRYSTGAGEVIAFIDTGISCEYAEHLGERIVARKNVIDDSDDVQDRHGHGTEMVSLAAGDGFMGVYGIAPDADIIIIKATSDEGVTNNRYLLRALQFARENGATIINISLGGHRVDPFVVNEIQEIIAEGITVVAAAGDFGQRDLLFPANQPGVVSVEARTEENARWELSNTGESTVLRFPGVNLMVLGLFEGELVVENYANGTSQAAAIASGYIALLRANLEERGESFDNEKILYLLGSLNSLSDRRVNFVRVFR